MTEFKWHKARREQNHKYNTQYVRLITTNQPVSDETLTLGWLEILR